MQYKDIFRAIFFSPCELKFSIHGYFSWFWKAKAIFWQKILLYCIIALSLYLYIVILLVKISRLTRALKCKIYTNVYKLLGVKVQPDLLDKGDDGVMLGRLRVQEGTPDESSMGLTALKTKSSVKIVRFLTDNCSASSLEASSLALRISSSSLARLSWLFSLNSRSDSRVADDDESALLRSTSNWQSFLSTFSKSLIKLRQICVDLFSTFSREMLKGRWTDEDVESASLSSSWRRCRCY